MAKSRSPDYPAIGLRDAIERVRKVYESGIYRSPVSKQVFAEHMGYKSLSGASLPVLSALAKYGLIEGRAGDTKVSDLAVSIIAHQPGDIERAKAIRAAAAAPDLFAELDQRYDGGKTTDQAIRSYLITRGFIPPAADAAIRAYRETKELVQSEPLGHNSHISETGKAARDTQPAEIGDFVQVEIDGAFSLEKPTRLRAIREHEGIRWGFIEGTETGVPMEQVVFMSKGVGSGGAPFIPPRLVEDRSSPGARREVFALDEGDVVLMFPEELSPESYEDLEAHLELFLRKAKRRAAFERKASVNPGGTGN